jgi:hypothetical protein
MANFKKTLDFEKSRQIPIKFDSAAKFESLKSTNYFWDFLGFCTFGISRHQVKGRWPPKAARSLGCVCVKTDEIHLKYYKNKMGKGGGT